ncbi:MAG: hypothetical protein ACYCW5_02595 [Thermoleophilia bacterium]
MAGLKSNQAGPFMLGVSFGIVGVPFMLRYFRLPDRIAFTLAGLGLLFWWLLPEKWIHKVLWFLPEGMNAGIEMFILSGIAVVAGAIWTVMYNSDILHGGDDALDLIALRRRPAGLRRLPDPGHDRLCKSGDRCSRNPGLAW